MHKKKLVFSVVLLASLFINSVAASAAAVLKQGMSGDEVTVLQKNLSDLGVFDSPPTGYYGNITAAAVKSLQLKYGLEADGVVGTQTLGLINSLVGKKQGTASRGNVVREVKTDYLMPWFDGAEDTFKVGDIAVVYDIETKLSFKVKRTYGYNHADCETLTASDTVIMKKIFGDQWSWERRAVIVTVNNKRIAASMAGMPHAGVENAPQNTYVSSRSGGYGSGENLDAVKGNGMSGHFDIHFYGSKTHGSDKVDGEHQAMVKKAAEWAKSNY